MYILSTPRTANLRTKILGFKGFDTGIISCLRGGILPESLSQRILAGIILVGRLGVPPYARVSVRREIRQRKSLQIGGFNLGWGGLASFFWGGLLHKRSLRHPAKAQNLHITELGLHPHTKPSCPRGGSLNCRARSVYAPAWIDACVLARAHRQACESCRCARARLIDLRTRLWGCAH